MTPTRLAHAKRLVIKVGSALVTNNGTGLDLNAINEWARQIAQLRQASIDSFMPALHTATLFSVGLLLIALIINIYALKLRDSKAAS